MSVLEKDAAVEDHKLKSKKLTFNFSVGTNDSCCLATVLSSDVSSFSISIDGTDADKANFDLSVLGEVEKVFEVKAIGTESYSGSDPHTGATYSSSIDSNDLLTISVTGTGGTTPDLAADARIDGIIEVSYKSKY